MTPPTQDECTSTIAPHSAALATVADEQLSVRFTDPEHWHQFTMSVGQRTFWSFVPEDQRAEVRAEAFSRLSRAAADDGSITVRQDLRHPLAVRP